jgi:hypothetical protein
MPKKLKKTTMVKVSDLKPKKDVKGGAVTRIVRSADPQEGGQ